MFRSKLRKWLPDPDSIRHNKWLRWCAPILGHPRLWHLHRRGVALGVAIGMVTGMIPGPVQMLVAGIVAVPLRAEHPGRDVRHALHQPVHLRAALPCCLQHRQPRHG
jgi:uncharacterized protein (DUF2062 family)